MKKALLFASVVGFITVVGLVGLLNYQQISKASAKSEAMRNWEKKSYVYAVNPKSRSEYLVRRKEAMRNFLEGIDKDIQYELLSEEDPASVDARVYQLTSAIYRVKQCWWMESINYEMKIASFDAAYLKATGKEIDIPESSYVSSSATWGWPETWFLGNHSKFADAGGCDKADTVSYEDIEDSMMDMIDKGGRYNEVANSLGDVLDVKDKLKEDNVL